MADALANFAYSTVAAAPSPAGSGTSLDVATGEGALFPAVPFNVTVWPAGEQPTSANAEIVRVTNVATDTLTIDRQEEGTSARTILVGDQIAQTVTALMVNDRLALSGGTMSGQIYRSDDATSFGEAGTFLKLRRVLSNAPSGSVYIVDLFGTGKGTATVNDRLTMIRGQIGDAATVVNKTITGMSRVGTTVTVTAAGHGFSNGDKIAIYGVVHTFDQQVNGAWTVANAATDTFDITVAGLSSGSYTNSGTATNRPMMYGFHAAVGPTLARGGLTGTAANADDVDGYVAYNYGTAKATDGYYLGRNGSIAGSEWITAFTVDAYADYGIRLNGTFTNYGLDFYSGTFTLGQMRLKNDVYVVGRNAADSGQVNMFKINTLNETDFASAVRFSGQVNIATGKDINIGNTGAGTKIGGGADRLMALWGATPIVQPGSAGGIGGLTLSNYTPGARSFDRNAYTMDGLADLVCQVVTILKGVGAAA